jgi:methylenetetrahydrofolate dehydrogenase (NADP+)/methenyltetrahydrofolate cyclohydrolase
LAYAYDSKSYVLTDLWVQLPPRAQMITADGKAISQKMLSEIRSALRGRSVSIAALWAGENMAIGRFVEMKKKAAASVGINTEIYHLNSPKEMTDKLKELSEDDNVNGIIVELPLPPGYDRDELLKLIPREKDIDVLNDSALLPPAVRALEALLEEYSIDPSGKTAAVFGQSILIGKPISDWLESRGSKVFRIDENTKNPEKLCLQADIVVSGVGKPGLITGDMIKKGAVVVDFGFETLGDKVAGDVDFDSIAPKSSLITPVPGGMGPMVIAAFLENAAKLDF